MLRNGTAIGPILPNEDDNEIYVWKIDDFTWTPSGVFLKDARTEKHRGFDIIAPLPCAPLDHIKALEERISKLEQINANLMGDDENVPRYTTKRFRSELNAATEKYVQRISKLKTALRIANDWLSSLEVDVPEVIAALEASHD